MPVPYSDDKSTAAADHLTDSLLTPRQAAEALQISPRTLWSLGNDGTIPIVRIGRLTRYSRRSIERFIADKSAS